MTNAPEPAPARRRASPAEAEIRDAVVAYLHAHLPDARLIHELPVGGCRADIVAVRPDRLIIFEIKSERDTLKRLDLQLKHFGRVTEDVVVVAHRKFFNTTPYDDGRPRCAWRTEASRARHVWAYPDGPDAYPSEWRIGLVWGNPAPPRLSAWLLLDLLWRVELQEICGRRLVKVRKRSTRADMMDRIVLECPGGVILPDVCAALRARDCLEADPPILPADGAAAKATATAQQAYEAML